ncbi:MAG TPA: nicotinate-nucleotide adenylyltransferase [Vicinamibacterales bacterium]|nr:nicotinate-nucleotide adenylyltransferase [Vicinamibacterales bacterium]
MITPRRLGLFGGTFDPIHIGHLAAAEAVRDALQLDEVWLLTSHVPPHRPQPMASVHHRFAMVALAVQERDALRASDVELLAPGPSYTSATLARLHDAGFAPLQLFFIVGADAFAEIAAWRDYPRFLDAAHFVAVNRGSRSVPRPDIEKGGAGRRIIDVKTGYGERIEPESPAIFLVDHPTPDVSSTAVRARCARGLSITGMVPPAVERHIQRHRLYAPDHGTSVERLTAGLLHEQEH